jgi:hypothetical protein
MSDYQSTSELPDADGKALLSELWSLYEAIQLNHDGKTRKVRRGSHEQRFAVADLEAAIIKAGAIFHHRQDFTVWLLRNDAFAVEAYDPIRLGSGLGDELCRLKDRMDHLAGRVNDLSKTVEELLVDTLEKHLEEKRSGEGAAK